MHKIELAISEGQTSERVALNELVIGWQWLTLNRVTRRHIHNIQPHHARLGELLRHLVRPASGAATNIQNAAWRADGSDDITAQCLTQGVMLKIEPLRLAQIVRQEIGTRLSGNGGAAAQRHRLFATFSAAPEPTEPGHARASMKEKSVRTISIPIVVSAPNCPQGGMRPA